MLTIHSLYSLVFTNICIYPVNITYFLYFIVSEWRRIHCDTVRLQNQYNESVLVLQPTIKLVTNGHFVCYSSILYSGDWVHSVMWIENKDKNNFLCNRWVLQSTMVLGRVLFWAKSLILLYESESLIKRLNVDTCDGNLGKLLFMWSHIIIKTIVIDLFCDVL